MGHRGDSWFVALAVATVLGVVLARPVPMVLVGMLAAGAAWRRSVVGAGLVLLLTGSLVGTRAWDGVVPAAARPYAGPASLVTDPVTRGAVTHVVLRIEGKRYDVWAAGSPRRRLERRTAQQVVWVEGRLKPPSPHRQRRLAVRHVVGEMDVDHVIDWTSGSPLARSTERTRRALERGATSLGAVDQSLFLGLVLGDDRAQPDALIDDFRHAGLGHLTAVSGQNVAFLLAVAMPALRRCRPGWRWGITVGLLAWFAALTRFEPSVLRATVMAGLAATAFGLGRPASPLRLLSLATTGLVLVDPFLVWSVGFWLSVCATLGIVLLAARIEALLPGPRWLAVPVSVSLAAQIGVAPIAWWVFGGEAALALPANALAEPAAAFVMTYGLPAGLLAGAVPGPVAALLHGPTILCLRWLRWVARLAAEGDVVPLRLVAVAGHLGILGWWARAAWRARRRRPVPDPPAAPGPRPGG